MYDPSCDFRLLKQAVSIGRFLEHRGLSGRLRQHGNRLVGPCPIHRGDNPAAFVVDLDKNVWYCFTGCNGGGDVVDLVRKVDGVGYAEAARRLAAVAALPLAAPQNVEPSPPRLRPAFLPFTRTLPLDPHEPFLRAKGISVHTARKFEAGRWRGRGFLAGCVGLRLHDLAGHPLGYAGRRLDPEQAKLLGKWRVPLGLPKSEILYGAHRLLDPAMNLVVTECPWGVMRLAQVGIPAVALLGTHLGMGQRRHLAQARRVVLLFDGDPAGRLGARRAWEALTTRTEVHVLSLPEGADPDDLPDSTLRSLVRPFFLS